YGTATGLPHFPSLNNGGDILSLKNEKGEIIHQVHYTKDNYHNTDQSDGGWTLEMQYPNYPCVVASENWSAGKASMGGTPGKIPVSLQNAIPSFKVDYLKVVDSLHLDLKLNLRLDNHAISSSIFTLNHQLLTEAAKDSWQNNLLHFTLSQPLQKSQKYVFDISHFESCNLSLS